MLEKIMNLQILNHTANTRHPVDKRDGIQTRRFIRFSSLSLVFQRFSHFSLRLVTAFVLRKILL